MTGGDPTRAVASMLRQAQHDKGGSCHPELAEGCFSEIRTMHKPRNILIIGVGNTLMADDGIGAYVAARLEEKQVSGLRTITIQQMTSDLLDEMLKAEHTIIVDASVEGEPVHFYKVKETDLTGASYSHYTSAVQLLKMAELVYARQLSVYICAVGAYDLTLQEKLSPRGKKNADQAVSTILGWINGHESQ